ncbi:MAG: aspartyl/glutamyl-tRNA amidotransferase subunit C [Gemmatimonadales bacterium]|nr:aspartyl/glutamyl-tRNA amidotransferase subunit C [Gemmatimonadales bacterium]
MSISRQDVLRVARLAELDVPDAAVEHLAAQLAEIVDYVGQLAPVSDEGTSLPVGPEQTALRRDVVASVPLVHGIESIAPAMVDGFFVVPRLAAMDD